MTNKVPDEKTRESVAKATINHPSIRLAASDPSLIGKVKVRVPDTSEPIFWYIKFNIVLDPLSISKKSMTVMETGGYIIDTEISYDTEKNLIVIKPVDPYEEGIFYILNLTRKVRSRGGNNLKRDIHILFKIKDNRIEDYKVLGENVEVARPRKKPEKLKAQTAMRVYGFTPEQQAKVDAAPRGTLPYGAIRLNILLIAIGIAVALIGLLASLTNLVLTGTGILAAGIVHLVIQLRDRKRRSSLLYNIGAMFFNAGLYKMSAKRLSKAFSLDETNELAEYAVNKCQFYI